MALFAVVALGIYAQQPTAGQLDPMERVHQLVGQLETANQRAEIAEARVDYFRTQMEFQKARANALDMFLTYAKQCIDRDRIPNFDNGPNCLVRAKSDNPIKEN